MAKPQYEPEAVRALFDEMAATYGPVNLISSFGFAARWRHQAVEGLPLSSALCIVDLMSGMGELWRSLSRGLSSSARVVAIDLSPRMVERAPRSWEFTVEACVTDVLAWEPGSAIADIVVSSFGLKTFDRDQLRQLAEKVERLLKPGGTYSFVEISVPPFRPLRALYMFYLKRVIPWIGYLFLGNPDNYRMLGVYTTAFESSKYFSHCLLEAGLEVQETSYFFGCATGARGRKRPG